jgi:hypothetical protein
VYAKNPQEKIIEESHEKNNNAWWKVKNVGSSVSPQSTGRKRKNS